jgi:uncharacterized membrane protein YhhN
MMFIILCCLFAIFLLLKIIFSLRKQKILKYYFTPLVTLSVIAFPLYYLYASGTSRYAVLVTAALVFSLAGDIINMREEKDNSHLYYSAFFFLIAHVFYIFAFSGDYNFSLWQIAVALLLVGMLIRSWFLFHNKLKSLLLKIFIPLYSVTVSASLLIGVGTLSSGIIAKTLLIAAGILLLWASDLFLGLHSFWHKIKYDSLLVWGLYAPGQLLIALSCFV